jgi:hypothetical protein
MVHFRLMLVLYHNSGFHEMKRSPLGHKADLNPLATDTNTVFLCFRPSNSPTYITLHHVISNHHHASLMYVDVQPVLAAFNNYSTPL